MEKLFDKLGLYDLWTTLFPGSVFLVLLKSTHNFCTFLASDLFHTSNVFEQALLFLNTPVYIPETANEFLVFLILSFGIGMILQELSCYVKQWTMFRTHSPRDVLLDRNSTLFSEEQHDYVLPYLNALISTGFNDMDSVKSNRLSRLCFSRINIYMQDRGLASRYVKLNILHNECLSLATAFLIVLFVSIGLTISLIINDKVIPALSMITYFIIFALCFCLLLHASKKFYSYWVKNLVMAYVRDCEKQENKAGGKNEKG